MTNPALKPPAANQPPEKSAGKRRARTQQLLRLAALLLVGGLAIWYFLPGPTATPPKSVPLSTIVRDAQAGKIKTLAVNDNTHTLVATYDNGKKVTSGYPTGFGSILTTDFSKNVTITAAPIPKSDVLLTLGEAMLPMLLILGFLLYFVKNMGGGKLPGLTALRSAPTNIPSTSFADVGGAGEAVAELTEVVDFLQHPEKYTASGARVPHGVLLVGPPGTGKTLLARAVAGEAGVPFFTLSGSDFVEIFVGVGASRMRQVFANARKAGPSIVFIDELDAVGRARGAGPATGANDEADRTLNALLVEMDGFEDSPIIVLGATNRPEVLDSALTRPGRFDRQITVGMPDRQGRLQILELLTRTKALDPSCDLAGLSRRTSTLTGADLDFLINEAALQAAREGVQVITQAHLEHALEVTVIGRARSSMLVDPHEREITAWHEAGHTVAALTLEAADNPVRVSIIPRGVAGGVTWMDADDRQFISRSRAHAQLTVLLAGRAGEMALVGEDFTSGASSDLATAGHLATAMVTEWAMSDLGPHITLPSVTGELNPVVGTEVDRLLSVALGEAKELLAKHQALHEAVAAELLANDTVDGPRLRELAHSLEGRDVPLAPVRDVTAPEIVGQPEA